MLYDRAWPHTHHCIFIFLSRDIIIVFVVRIRLLNFLQDYQYYIVISTIIILLWQL
jgi:low affinity Fe/Cu permease